MAGRSEFWRLGASGFGLLAGAPLFMWGFAQQGWVSAAALLLLAFTFHHMYLGPTLGVIHNLVHPRTRATASAVYIVLVNLFAQCGPLLVGLCIDLVTAREFAASRLGPFAEICPGGSAGAGAGAALQAACSGALASGTRFSLSWVPLLNVAAAAWMFYGARSLRTGRGPTLHSTP